MDPIDTVIKRGGLSLSRYHLKINPEFISNQNATQVRSEPKTINSADITGYRFGVTWLRGFEFPIGRLYQIQILSKKGEIIKISFISFYGIGKTRLNRLYNDIIRTLEELYFESMVDGILINFNRGDDVEMDKVILSNEGVFIRQKGSMIVWDDLELREYASYFSISSKTNPSFANMSFYYSTDWNSYPYLRVFQNILEINNSN